MPRLIDYTARFELIREAVVRIAARDGGAAVSLTSVAREMRVSSSTVRRELRSPDVLCETGLVLLARRWQIKRFTHGRPPRHVGDLVERARWALWIELPLREAEVEEKRAWAELVAHGTGQRVADLRDAHDELLGALVSHLVVGLEVPEDERESQAVHLRALVDGLTAAVCAGRISTKQVESCLDAQVRAISRLPTDVDGSKPELEPVNFSRAVGGAPR